MYIFLYTYHYYVLSVWTDKKLILFAGLEPGTFSTTQAQTNWVKNFPMYEHVFSMYFRYYFQHDWFNLGEILFNNSGGSDLSKINVILFCNRCLASLIIFFNISLIGIW